LTDWDAEYPTLDDLRALANWFIGRTSLLRQGKHPFPIIDLSIIRCDTDALPAIRQQDAEKFCVFPITKAGQLLTVAWPTPGDADEMEKFAFVTGLFPDFVLADKQQIRAAIRAAYGS
jgi:hypothetical protein